MAYTLGALVRISCTFTDQNGVPTDPASVSAAIKTPTGTVTNYAYPATIVRDGVGLYHVDVSTTGASVAEAGTWVYRWASTGAGQAAAEGSFAVLVSAFS